VKPGEKKTRLGGGPELNPWRKIAKKNSDEVSRKEKSILKGSANLPRGGGIAKGGAAI